MPIECEQEQQIAELRGHVAEQESVIGELLQSVRELSTHNHKKILYQNREIRATYGVISDLIATIKEC